METVEVYAVPRLTLLEAGESATDRRLDIEAEHLEENVVVVRASPRDVPANFVAPGGLVDLRLSARKPGSDCGWSTSTTAQIVVVEGEQMWADPALTLDLLSPRQAETAAPPELAVTVASMGDDGVPVALEFAPRRETLC